MRPGGALTLVMVALLLVAAAAPLETPAMQSYVFGLLRRGPAWTAERTAVTDSLQRGHMANIQRMASEGFLLGAGPFSGAGELAGVFIFRPDSLPALRAQAERDPAIRARRLALDLWVWHAPVGIGEPYRRLAATPGHRDSMVATTFVFLRKGPQWTAATNPEFVRDQQAHLQNIFAGLASGELAIAGPLEDAGDRIGILVFRGDTTVARRFAGRDPQVTSKRMVLETHRWLVGYGVMPGDTTAPR